MSSSNPIVAVDAMGGDFGPEIVVPGAVQALTQDGGFRLALYGDEAAINEQLASLAVRGLPVSVVPCSQNISMTESPAAAIRGKPDSPIARAIQDHKQGQVQAVVSAGSTGAMVAASLLILGRLPSVDRPAIATLVPTVSDPVLLLDAGANVQCTPEHLVCFARMGEFYSREMLSIEKPRIGLLNIGEEETKGTELAVATHQLLRAAALNFVGNIESNQMLLGKADVIVTDGFTGNMALKLMEGFGMLLQGLTSNEDLTTEERRAIPPVLKIMRKRFSYEMYGGALLLGIAGVSIISHGRSTRRAVTNAVLGASKQAQANVPRKLQAILQSEG